MSECSCRNKIYSALFWLSLFIPGPSLFAKSFPVAKFTQLNVDNGLSHNITSDVVQNQQGFVWIGTQYRLQRYDGQKLKTFLHDPADTISIRGNNIDFLEIDQSGQLLIGISDNYGIDQYDPITEKFIHHHLDFAVDNLGLTQDGGIWLGNGRELRYKAKEEKTFSIYPFPAHPKHSLYMRLWSHSILEDKNNTVWVGTKRRLYQVGANGSAGEWWLPCDEQYISADTTFRIHDILEDRNGNFWLATEQDLCIQSDSDQCLLPYRAPKGQRFRFEGKDVSRIELDGDNQLWICTRSEGLGILNLATSVLEYIPPNFGGIAERILEGIGNLFTDRLGSIWLISRGYGIYVYHPKTQQFKWYKILQNSSLPELYMVFEDFKGALWLLGEQVELEAAEGTYPSLNKKTLEAIDNSLAVSEAPGGIFWFSTAAGVERLDVNQGTLQSFFETYQSVGIQPGSNIAMGEWVDRKGNFWAGFWGGGAAYIDENDLGSPNFFHGSNKAPASPMSCFSEAITKSKDGWIWFGSYYNGLIVYDPTDGSFKNFQKEQGKENWLNNNSVQCILEDQNGILWLGTYGGGMYRFDPNTEQFRHYGIKDGLLNEIFVNFGPDDGLPKTMYISLSPAGSVSGQMYLATEQGYVAFHPDSIRMDTTPPNTAIVKMSRYRRDQADGKPIEGKGVSLKEHIVFSDKDYIVAFELAAITFHKARQTTIDYKLEGFQNEWIQLEDIRQVSFPSLPAGDYALLVRSANAHSFWDKTPARLGIKVYPPGGKPGGPLACMFLLPGPVFYSFGKGKHAVSSSKANWKKNSSKPPNSGNPTRPKPAFSPMFPTSSTPRSPSSSACRKKSKNPIWSNR